MQQSRGLWAIALVVLLQVGAWSGTVSADEDSIEDPAALALMPFGIEANQGQEDDGVRFIFDTGNAQVLFLAGGVRFRTWGDDLSAQTSHEFVMRWAPDGMPVATDRLDIRSSFYLGSDPAGWLTDVPSFRSVVYRDIAPGVDLLWYVTDAGQLQFDLLVSPGADPSAFSFSLEGAEGSVDPDGRLRITSNLTHVFDRPYAYQTPFGRQTEVPVESAWKRVGESSFGYQVGGYDPRLPLVIDPVVETLSTHYWVDDLDLFVDSEGLLVHGGNGPGGLIHILRYTPDGQLVARLLIGGTGRSLAADMARADDGTIYFVGSTEAQDFPMRAAMQASYGGNASDGFVFAVTADLRDLVFSTYFGGEQTDLLRGMALLPDGSLAVYRSERQTHLAWYNGTIYRVDPTQKTSRIVRDLQIGHRHDWWAEWYEFHEPVQIETSHDGSLWILTSARTSPTTPNAWDREPSTALGALPVLMRIAPSGRSVFSTRLDGSGGFSNLIPLENGNMMIVGQSQTIDLAVMGPDYRGWYRPRGDAIVAEVAPSGNPVASAHLGGKASGDTFTDAFIGADGVLYLTGITSAEDFPADDPHVHSEYLGLKCFITAYEPSLRVFRDTYFIHDNTLCLNADEIVVMNQVAYVLGTGKASDDSPHPLVDPAAGELRVNRYLSRSSYEVIPEPPPIPNVAPSDVSVQYITSRCSTVAAVGAPARCGNTVFESVLVANPALNTEEVRVSFFGYKMLQGEFLGFTFQGATLGFALNHETSWLFKSGKNQEKVDVILRRVHQTECIQRYEIEFSAPIDAHVFRIFAGMASTGGPPIMLDAVLTEEIWSIGSEYPVPKPPLAFVHDTCGGGDQGLPDRIVIDGGYIRSIEKLSFGDVSARVRNMREKIDVEWQDEDGRFTIDIDFAGETVLPYSFPEPLNVRLDLGGNGIVSVEKVFEKIQAEVLTRQSVVEQVTVAGYGTSDDGTNVYYHNDAYDDPEHHIAVGVEHLEQIDLSIDIPNLLIRGNATFVDSRGWVNASVQQPLASGAQTLGLEVSNLETLDLALNLTSGEIVGDARFKELEGGLWLDAAQHDLDGTLRWALDVDAPYLNDLAMDLTLGSSITARTIDWSGKTKDAVQLVATIGGVGKLGIYGLPHHLEGKVEFTPTYSTLLVAASDSAYNVQWDGDEGNLLESVTLQNGLKIDLESGSIDTYLHDALFDQLQGSGYVRLGSYEGAGPTFRKKTIEMTGDKLTRVQFWDRGHDPHIRLASDTFPVGTVLRVDVHDPQETDSILAIENIERTCDDLYRFVWYGSLPWSKCHDPPACDWVWDLEKRIELCVGEFETKMV